MIRKGKMEYLFVVIAIIASSQPVGSVISTCSPSPCHNQAPCRTVSGQHYCECGPRHVGELCQHPNPCLRQPCVNGKCQPDVRNGTVEFKCQCPIGFTASLCEVPVKSACQINPCQNHGTCQLVTLDIPKCLCPNGFTGELCEMRDFCHSAPCLNGGLCTSTQYDFRCTCPSGLLVRLVPRTLTNVVCISPVRTEASAGIYRAVTDAIVRRTTLVRTVHDCLYHVNHRRV